MYLMAGVPWGKSKQQQPVRGCCDWYHLCHRWFESASFAKLWYERGTSGLPQTPQKPCSAHPCRNIGKGTVDFWMFFFVGFEVLNPWDACWVEWGNSSFAKPREVSEVLTDTERKCHLNILSMFEGLSSAPPLIPFAFLVSVVHPFFGTLVLHVYYIVP